MKQKLAAGVGISLLLLLASCFDDGPTMGLYGWYLDTNWSDGYSLHLYRPDSSYIDVNHVPGTPFYKANSSYNFWCADKDSLIAYQPENGPDFNHTLYPVYVHRASGRVDTLHNSFIYRATAVPLGFVQRECEIEKWLILECKLPGEILSHSFLADTAYEAENPMSFSMYMYTYEGQERIFESDLSHFWIISLHTTDMYGPLTEKELAAQLTQLGIALPVILKQRYSPYVRPGMSDGSFADIPEPKHFIYWPHDKKRKPKVIGK